MNGSKTILTEKGVKKKQNSSYQPLIHSGNYIMNDFMGKDHDDPIDFVDTNEDTWNDQSTYGLLEEYFEEE